MGAGRGKLTCLAWLLVRHGEAVEADLYPVVDLLDLYRQDADLSLRRAWVLIAGRLLVESDPLQARPGTALSRSLHGEVGDWTRLDHFVGGALGVKPPEDKARRAWRAAQQARLKAQRAEIEARRAAAATSAGTGS
jgi:hypothetical protein